MFVLGTAGHIDHGKSALVRALTGIDPDRLREEKERGMTIDLGFAWLSLPSGREVSIVDVPGHERLIKNMVAGVGGIDLAILVVDASEGVMPQTREHLAILDILGIRSGIAVVTKVDLVDSEWLELVRVDVARALDVTGLADSPVVAVSALTGSGLDELTATMDHLLDAIPEKRDIGRPRLPVDRVFTIAGSGTVVTGTLLDGSFSVGQEVELSPSGRRARIRGLQSHKTRQDTVGPGSRAGVNLVGLAKAEIERGEVLTIPGWLVPTKTLIVELHLISYLKRPLKNGTTVNFHTGTAQALAKVRLLEQGEITPGGTAWAHLTLNQAVALAAGDRFIIRSPDETLGGGRIIEAHAGRYRRFPAAEVERLKTRAGGTLDEVLLTLVEAGEPLPLERLMTQSQRPADEVEPVVMGLIGEGRLMAAGEGEGRVLMTASGWQKLVSEATTILTEYHRKYPLRLGMPRAELTSRIGRKALPSLMQRLVGEEIIAQEGSLISLPGHEVRLSLAQEQTAAAFIKSLASNPYSPPGDLIPEPGLLNLLVSRGEVVKVSSDVVFTANAYRDMVAAIEAHLAAYGEITVAQVRDMFRTSRKYALSLLEYLDGQKITRRVGDVRVRY